MILLCGLALLFGLLACGGSGEPAPGGTSEGAAVPEERLRAMSGLLAGAAAIRFDCRESFRWLDPTGEWQTGQAEWKLTIWRPDAMRITMQSKGAKEVDADLYYDGWRLTFVDHRRKTWAWASVPQTLDAMLDEIFWRFDLPIPMQDMLYTSPYDKLMTEDTASRYEGREEIEGRACDRFAFTHAAVDWEIWIEAGETPLPRRLDILHKSLEGQPKSEIVFTAVDLAAAVDEAIFTFDPQDGYNEIPAVENPPPDEGGGQSSQNLEVSAEGSES